jgi:uncharacterized protein (DUF697 family)
MSQELLPVEEQNFYSISGGSTEQTGSNELSNIFLTFVTNLIRKGGSTMIHLLGDFFGVSVDNVDPNQIIDEFNEKLQDPETREKFLIMMSRLIEVVSPPLKEAIQQASQIFGTALQTFLDKGMQATVNSVGAIPILGEAVEALRTMLNIVSMILGGANGVVQTARLGINTAKTVRSGLQENAQEMQDMSNIARTTYPAYSGGAEKKIKKIKKLQTNSLNRISNAVQEFQGTKKRKHRGTKVRIPKLNTTKSNRFKKTRKN